MDSFSNKNLKLVYNLIYLFFVFSLIYLFGLAIGIKISFSLQILIIVLESMIVKFFIFNPLVLYILIAIGFLSSLLVNRYIITFIVPFTERMYSLFENIIYNILGKEIIAIDNTLIFFCILIALVSFFTALIMFKFKKSFLLLPVYFGFFLYYWYNFVDQAKWMSSFFLVSFFILLGLNKYLRERSQTYNYDFDRLYKPWLQTVVKYSILIVVIALLLPKGNNYIQWPWLQQKVYTAFPFVENLRSYNIYSRGTGEATLFNFSITGFQGETTRLGGPVSLSDKKIMTVYSDESNYLRGVVRQFYTGNAWETIDESSTNYRLKEDFSGLSDEDKNSYYEKVNIIITNNGFASTTLFSPYKPETVGFVNNSWIGVSRDESLIISQGVYDTETYYIQAQKPLPYGILVSLGMNQKKDSLDNLSLYLQVPEDRITQRTKNLVKEIVSEKENDYKKAVSIENYLRNNYKYNLNVNKVPLNQEFIDYFLFDELEGYCTYYATSLAIMLRLEGIPSRYVEGYLAQDSIKEGIYEVRHENAHAWVEAFIEPVGWMTFEPTPAYSIETRLENYKPVEVGSNFDPSLDSEIFTNPRNDTNDPDMIMDDGIELGGDYNYDNYKNSPEASRDLSLIILAILLLLIPLRYIFGLFRYWHQETKAKKLSNNDRTIFLYKQILKLAKMLGFPQKNGETHYEYAARVAYRFYDPNEKGLKEITDIFVRSKYSTSPSTDEDILDLELYRINLDKRVKKHLGKRSYYYNKYLKNAPFWI